MACSFRHALSQRVRGQALDETQRSDKVSHERIITP